MHDPLAAVRLEPGCGDELHAVRDGVSAVSEAGAASCERVVDGGVGEKLERVEEVGCVRRFTQK